MKSITSRINNIIGQLEGIKRMIENQDDCIKVLTQVKATRSGIGRVAEEIMSNRMDQCMKTMSDNDKKLFIKLKKYVTTN